jgi:hypothetical protein
MLEDYYVKPSTIDRVRSSWLAPQKFSVLRTKDPYLPHGPALSKAAPTPSNLKTLRLERPFLGVAISRHLLPICRRMFVGPAKYVTHPRSIFSRFSTDALEGTLLQAAVVFLQEHFHNRCQQLLSV